MACALGIGTAKCLEPWGQPARMALGYVIQLLGPAAPRAGEG